MTEIRLTDVTFGYSRYTTIFEGLDLTLDKFPVVVLGPNGAGKSTLLSLIAGMRRAQRGRVLVGSDERSTSRKDALRSQSVVGWLPQQVRPMPGMNLRQQVAYAGWLKGMSYSNAWAAAETALTRVGLGDRLRKKAGQLSGGQLRRLGIAQAIVNDPIVIVLDEPYAGLDPEQRDSVRDTLLALAPTASLVVSTHQTEDVELVYQHVVVINDGRVLLSDSVQDLTSLAAEGDRGSRIDAGYRNLLRSAASTRSK